MNIKSETVKKPVGAKDIIKDMTPRQTPMGGTKKAAKKGGGYRR